MTQPRTLSFQYGALLIGAGQSDGNYTLTGVYTFEEGYQTASLSFEVGISSTSPAGMLASEAALIAAYSIPDQTLTVELSSTARHVYDPALNTGFNQAATAQKIPAPQTSSKFVMYRCSVVVQLPADLATRAGRRSSSVDVQQTQSGRRTVVINGVYTALANNAARAQFAASVEDYANAVLGGLGGTFELLANTQALADDQDKLLSFRRAYKEILRNQGAGTPDLAAVVDPSMIIRRSIAQTDSPVLGGIRAAPPITLQVDYTADVRFGETTDLAALWEGTLRDFVLSEVEAVTGTSILAVTSEDWGLDPVDNRIDITMGLLGDGGANFWQFRRDWNESQNEGIILRPVWNGDKFARDRYQGPASHTMSLTYMTVGPSLSGSQGPGGMPRVAHPAAPPVSGFIRVRTAQRMRERSVGIAGAEVPIYIATTQYFYVRANTTDAGSSSPSTSPPVDSGQTRTRGQQNAIDGES